MLQKTAKKAASAAPQALHGHAHEIDEVEKLTHEMKRLLVTHENALDEEGIRHELETLERWMESYRHGLSAANKISENGVVWLRDMRSRLQLAADEMQRMEGEGGTLSTDNAQADHAEQLRRAVHHIDEVLPSLEETFSHA
jgi:exonuclease VII small subunit